MQEYRCPAGKIGCRWILSVRTPDSEIRPKSADCRIILKILHRSFRNSYILPQSINFINPNILYRKLSTGLEAKGLKTIVLPWP
jgi:hypothetical protein